MKKEKTKLIITLSVALLSVLTMGVSTFAWFQANADVQVRTETSSTTITVSKPDDFVFYAYKGNLPSYESYTTEYDPEEFGDFDNDFETVSAGNSSDLTSLDGISPGKSYFYCVTASNLATNRIVKLTLDKFISNDLRKQTNSNYHRYRYGTTVDINIGWAMNIYAYAVYTNNVDPDDLYNSFITDPATNGVDGDRFTYGYSASYNTDPTTDPLYSGSYAASAPYTSTIIDKSASPIVLYNHTVTALEGSKAFVFYCVQFSQDDSTQYYEVTGSSDETRKMTPINESAHRYFKPYDYTNGAYYLTGTINGSSVANKTAGYSLCKIDANHYQIKGITLAVGDTVAIKNNAGSTTHSFAGSISSAEESLYKPGKYTIDYYPNETTKVVLTKSNVTDMGYNSNCFAGLRFALTNMSFKFSETAA